MKPRGIIGLNPTKPFLHKSLRLKPRGINLKVSDTQKGLLEAHSPNMLTICSLEINKRNCGKVPAIFKKSSKAATYANRQEQRPTAIY